MKIPIGQRIVFAVPIVLIGANVKGKPNYNTVANFGAMNIGPPTVYVSMSPKHYTAEGIRNNRTFSVNVPSEEVVQKLDYCGLVSGHKIDKSEIFESFYGKLKTAPMIVECPINMECKVVKTPSIFPEDGGVFIAEVTETYSLKKYIKENENGKIRVNAQNVNPVVFFGGGYWTLDKQIADAFRIGKSFRSEQEHQLD